ncbi:MAG: DUF4290 domain-containing protein [Flavobacteriales bacterium]|jgi:hypothetical protein|nr:DUF4290 domain-containing protein [Flavobacteriales bacterium]
MINDQSFLPYNSERSDLVIPEYGRNIHQMVSFALSIADREERNKVVRAIISVMGQLFPHLRDIEDYNHKLWDHLHIMSDFKLDVDSPYPIPERETLQAKPDRVSYPGGNIRYGHYGKIVQEMINKCSAMEDGEEKVAFTMAIGNLMKRHYITYNRSSVEDALIANQLKELSANKLSLPEGAELVSVNEINRQNASNPVNNGVIKKKNNKRKMPRKR